MMKYRVKYPLRIRSDLTTLHLKTRSQVRVLSVLPGAQPVLARADEVIK
jgi:hypothetical protein